MKTRDFECWTFEKSPVYRKVAPGIFGETTIFVVEELARTQGVNKFYTIGHDLTIPTGGDYPHFWQQQQLHIPGTIIPWDVQLNIEGSKYLYHWFRSIGVGWEVVGDSNLSEEIPRVSI